MSARDVLAASLWLIDREIAGAPLPHPSWETFRENDPETAMIYETQAGCHLATLSAAGLVVEQGWRMSESQEPQEVPDKTVVLREIAAMLDHPSVYMGGPSQRNMRRAEQIYAAVVPAIAAAERERCIEAIAEYEFPLDIAADHQAMLDMRVGLDLAAHAIRALGDADD